jgi:hypothetical protein
MRETYIEGVASHDSPESCVGAREGDSEALTGVRAGRDMEPRNHIDRGADAVHVSGRQHDQERQRERLADTSPTAHLTCPQICGRAGSFSF